MDLRTSEIIALAKRLRELPAAFAARETQLERELGAGRYAMERRHNQASAAIDAAEVERSRTANEECASSEQKIKATYESRRQRVTKAHIALAKNLPQRVQQARASWLSKLQTQRMKAERLKVGGIESARAERDRVVAALSDEDVRLDALKRRAAAAFAGYPSFRKLLGRPGSVAVPEGSEEDMLTAAVVYHQEAEENLAAFRKLRMPAFFRSLPLPWLLLFLVMAAGAAALIFHLTAAAVAAAFGGAALLLIVVHQWGRMQCASMAGGVARSYNRIRDLRNARLARAEERLERAKAEIETRLRETAEEVQEKWQEADVVESTIASKLQAKLELQGPRILERNEQRFILRMGQIQARRDGLLSPVKLEMNRRRAEAAAALAREKQEMDQLEAQRRLALQQEWISEMSEALSQANAACNATAARVPSWSSALVADWHASQEFSDAAKVGTLPVEIPPNSGPHGPGYALDYPKQLDLPLGLAFPLEGSLLLESDGSYPPAAGILQNAMLRILAGMPPGKATFTIIDPVGLGQSFAGLMHLADYEASLINRRIWTQPEHIEERLHELSEHIEKVIQMYLRNEYDNISDYNRHAGSVAEKYHFVVIADLPVQFSETAARKLQSILVSGQRCGVYTLIHWDRKQQLPEGLDAATLRSISLRLCVEKGGIFLGEGRLPVALEAAPSAEIAAAFAHKVGKASIDSNRVEVPFSLIAPPSTEYWSQDTTSELRIAIGRTGATKLQYLAIGKGTRQHALFAGKTGSGKSTLFHVIITNLALTCSPDQVEFYLIDFKKGVEFKCYATHQLPHARVVAIESDREFGLSVLQRVDEELRRRGDLFRKLGAQDIAGYKRAGGTEAMPRSLLIIDEFQEFFVEDDPIAQQASLLFDRIVRQGRAFGIHVLLGSQTLGGAYTLARATLGQMAIRVALQCNEADSYLIMDESNSAPRLLSRPGEGIYNDAGGAVEGNSPFQVVWLPDQERDGLLAQLHQLNEKRGAKRPRPVIFEGNAPADIRENLALRIARSSSPETPPVTAKVWLGAPNSIKGPTEAVFRRQSGCHLLVVGQREDALANMLQIAMISLASQFPAGAASILFADTAPEDSTEGRLLAKCAAAAGSSVRIVRPHELGAVLSELDSELKSRSDGGATGAPSRFLLINGLSKFKKLRAEDDFSFGMGETDAANPATQFGNLIREGSSFGMHIIAAVDTYNNVARYLNRKALSEFEMRVVFQMSASDSASLIDSPKAGSLGLHRALYYNEHDGILETFRPYAEVETAWLEENCAPGSVSGS